MQTCLHQVSARNLYPLLVHLVQCIRLSFAVYFEGNLFALDNDLLGVPFVILGRRLQDILHRVQTTRSAWIPFVGIVHLAFEALFGPAFLLKRGMEIDPSVAVGHRLYVSFEVEILEWLFITHIEDVTSFALANDAPIYNGPALRILIDLPAIGAFAIEQFDEFGDWRIERN